MIETEDEAIPAINSTRYSSTHLPAGGGAALERSGVSHRFLRHDLQLWFSTPSQGTTACTCQTIVITLVRLTRQPQKTGGEQTGTRRAMRLWE